MMTFKKVCKSLIVRIGQYFDLIEKRDNPQYYLKDTHIGQGVTLGNIKLEGNNSLTSNIHIMGNVSLGLCTTLGRNCILHGGDIQIGRYCQIAPFVAMYATDHPTDYVTIYVHKHLFKGELVRNSNSSPIRIGHDVWIGHGAIILKGVTIGNGAVIGAGSVVTRNIPDYSIAVGNPAHIIKKRFDDEIIQLLQESAWWQYSPEELEECRNLFTTNLNQDRDLTISMIRGFIDFRREQAQRKVKSFKPE